MSFINFNKPIENENSNNPLQELDLLFFKVKNTKEKDLLQDLFLDTFVILEKQRLESYEYFLVFEIKEENKLSVYFNLATEFAHEEKIQLPLCEFELNEEFALKANNGNVHFVNLQTLLKDRFISESGDLECSDFYCFVEESDVKEIPENLQSRLHCNETLSDLLNIQDHQLKQNHYMLDLSEKINDFIQETIEKNKLEPYCVRNK